MRAIRLHPPGRIEGLRLDEAAPPQPRPGQVLVRVHAAALTRDKLQWPTVSADDSHLKDAAELEELGYATLGLPGGQIDSLDRISQIVQATMTVPVGSAIIWFSVYRPAEVAGLYAQLQARVPDRFIVGLGGPQQPRQLQALKECLDELGQSDPPVPPHRRILAALGPRKLELARDRFAEAIRLLVTPGYTREARRILSDQSTLIVSQMVVLGTDAARAREAGRGHLRFLSGVRGYPVNFARMGFTDTDISQLSDHLVDELVTWGDAETIGAHQRGLFPSGKILRRYEFGEISTAIRDAEAGMTIKPVLVM